MSTSRVGGPSGPETLLCSKLLLNSTAECTADGNEPDTATCEWFTIGTEVDTDIGIANGYSRFEQGMVSSQAVLFAAYCYALSLLPCGQGTHSWSATSGIKIGIFMDWHLVLTSDSQAVSLTATLQVSQGLSQLSRTASGQHPAYLRLDITKTNLDNTDPIAHCCYLQQIILSHNQLTTLRSLGQLRDVISLDASYNQLTQVTPSFQLTQQVYTVHGCEQQFGANA